MSAFDLGLLLVPFAPSIEIVFFERPNTMVQRLGRPLEWELEVAAKFAPKKLLERFLSELGYPNSEALVADLSTSEIADLRQHREINQLRSFVTKTESKLA